MFTTKITHLVCYLLLAAAGYIVFRSPPSFSSPLSLYNPCLKCPTLPIKSSGGDELGLLLEKAAMPDRTVIITFINDAVTEQSVKSETALLDIFLESFWLGEDTRQLLDHLLIVAVNQGAYERCKFKRLNCYWIDMGKGEFRGELTFNRMYAIMMWERVVFKLDVLRRGYNILATDGDVVWLRNPFPRLNYNSTIEFQIAQDWSWRSDSFCCGFYFVRSNNRTISLFEKWYSIKDRFGNEQNALIWLMQHGFFQKLGLHWKFLDNRYISGFADPRYSIATVNTIHATVCGGIERKMDSLTAVLRDWKRYKEAMGKNNESFGAGDVAAEFKWTPWEASCKRPFRRYRPRKGT